MVSGRLGNLVIAIHGGQPPTEEEWARYLARCEAVRSEVTASGGTFAGLTITDGGAPNPVQRNALRALLIDAQGHFGQGAMLTDSVVSRSLVSLFSMFVRGLGAFSPPHWREALRHVGVPAEREGGVCAELLRLSAPLGEVRSLVPLSAATRKAP
jgi:hypothetical protein